MRGTRVGVSRMEPAFMMGVWGNAKLAFCDVFFKGLDLVMSSQLFLLCLGARGRAGPQAVNPAHSQGQPQTVPDVIAPLRWC